MRVPGSRSRSEAQLLCTRDSVSPKRENVLWQKKWAYGRRNGRNFAASSLTPAATPLGLGISLEPIQLICNFLISSRADAAW